MARGTHNNRVKIVEDASDITNWGNTSFSQRKIAEKSQQFILNANIPLSNQRDLQVVDNNATITEVGAEYRVRATSDTNSNAFLRSKQRGNYISGNEAEAGIGIRIPTQPTGDAYIKWGYFERNAGVITGMYFRYDADGVWVVLEDSGTILEEVRQERWNNNTLQGGNEIGELDLKEGSVFQVNFVYYGYGPIIWEVGDKYLDNRYNTIPVHLTKVLEQVSISEPNLPIAVEVESGTSGVQLDAFVGGRQFSTYGKASPQNREVGAYRIEQGSIGETFVPCISFKEKTGYENIFLTLQSLSVLSNVDLIYEIRLNGTLTGASFGVPNNYDGNEVATQWDTSASAITGGTAIKSGLIDGGAQFSLSAENLPERAVYSDDIYTLCLRQVSGTNGVATTFFEVSEAW